MNPYYTIRTGIIVKRNEVKSITTDTIHGVHTIRFDCGDHVVKAFVSEKERDLALAEFPDL